MLTGLFWGAVISFAGLFNGFYYIFTGESTSKADKFDNFVSMNILNVPLTQKSPGICTKRLNRNPPDKKGCNSAALEDECSKEGMGANQLCRIVVGISSQIGRDGHRDMGAMMCQLTSGVRSLKEL